MINLDEVKNMLERFQEAFDNGELDDAGEGALKALKWVTEDDDYSEMDGMLPEVPVCGDCGYESCSGAAGGECDDAEDGPIEVVKPDLKEFRIVLPLQGEGNGTPGDKPQV